MIEGVSVIFVIIFVAVAVTEGETGQHRNDEYCWVMAGGREREKERILLHHDANQ